MITSQANERNRSDPTRSPNRYLKRIFYGNATSTLASGQAIAPLGPDLSTMKWFFEVVFDYDDGHYDESPPNSKGWIIAHADANPAPTAWPVRNDAFSSYRAGFEVRSYRLCQRVLMFHHIPNTVADPTRKLPAFEGYDGLVRSTEFKYSYEENPQDARNPIYSVLLSVTQSGYKRQVAGDYLKKSLPLVEFTFSEAKIHDEIHTVETESLENLPYGLDGKAYNGWTSMVRGLSGF